MNKCRFSYIEQGDPISLQEFNNNSSETEPGYHGFVDTAIQALLKVRLWQIGCRFCITFQNNLEKIARYFKYFPQF